VAADYATADCMEQLRVYRESFGDEDSALQTTMADDGESGVGDYQAIMANLMKSCGPEAESGDC